MGRQILKPSISTEAAVLDIGKVRTKTVIGAGSQRATAQLGVNFASPKPSMILSADQNRLPPTFGGILSGAFQVPQLANTQKQYLLSRGPNFAPSARDDFFIRPSVPKLKLAEFSGDPLELPEWSTISSNRPRSKYGRQCKNESRENNGNGQGQRGDCWPWVHL